MVIEKTIEKAFLLSSPQVEAVRPGSHQENSKFPNCAVCRVQLSECAVFGTSTNKKLLIISSISKLHLQVLDNNRQKVLPIHAMLIKSQNTIVIPHETLHTVWSLERVV